jgi:hypothetical protein
VSAVFSFRVERIPPLREESTTCTRDALLPPSRLLTLVAERLNGTSSVAGVEAESVDSSAHDEWLLDEALDETFPASDPISPSIGTFS